MLLTAAEGKLYVFGTEEQPAEVDSTDAEALCAFYIAGRLHVMTAAGLRSYAYPGFAPLGTTDASRYPAVTLSAAPGPMPLRAEVGRRTLSGDYRREAALNTADSRAVESDIRAAYTALASEARAQGVMMQPALARYTLHDAAGNILFTSPAVLLGSAQCLRTQSLDCDSEGNLEGYTLTADTWRPRIAVPQYFCPGVHSVRVWLTPQLQPVDTSAQPSVWLRHGTTASATVSVRLGRSELAIDPANPATSGRVVFEAVARMDMTERCVAEMRATAGLETETDCGPEAMPAAELSAMRAVMRRRPEVADYTECSLRAPHGFSAECVAVSGDTVMWGNVRPRRYAGYPLPLFAASTSADAWSGFVAVDFADGSRAVWKGGGETGAPVRRNPAPDAEGIHARTAEIPACRAAWRSHEPLQRRAEASARGQRHVWSGRVGGHDMVGQRLTVVGFGRGFWRVEGRGRDRRARKAQPAAVVSSSRRHGSYNRLHHIGRRQVPAQGGAHTRAGDERCVLPPSRTRGVRARRDGAGARSPARSRQRSGAARPYRGRRHGRRSRMRPPPCGTNVRPPAQGLCRLPHIRARP